MLAGIFLEKEEKLKNSQLLVLWGAEVGLSKSLR
jgi:hypothetical protein